MRDKIYLRSRRNIQCELTARVGPSEGESVGDDVFGPFTSSQTPPLHSPEQHSALAVHEALLALHAQTKALFRLQPVPAVQRSSISAPVHNRPPVCCV